MLPYIVHWCIGDTQTDHQMSSKIPSKQALPSVVKELMSNIQLNACYIILEINPTKTAIYSFGSPS